MMAAAIFYGRPYKTNIFLWFNARWQNRPLARVTKVAATTTKRCKEYAMRFEHFLQNVASLNSHLALSLKLTQIFSKSSVKKLLNPFSLHLGSHISWHNWIFFFFFLELGQPDQCGSSIWHRNALHHFISSEISNVTNSFRSTFYHYQCQTIHFSSHSFSKLVRKDCKMQV